MEFFVQQFLFLQHPKYFLINPKKIKPKVHLVESKIDITLPNIIKYTAITTRQL